MSIACGDALYHRLISRAVDTSVEAFTNILHDESSAFHVAAGSETNEVSLLRRLRQIDAQLAVVNEEIDKVSRDRMTQKNARLFSTRIPLPSVFVDPESGNVSKYSTNTTDMEDHSLFPQQREQRLTIASHSSKAKLTLEVAYEVSFSLRISRAVLEEQFSRVSIQQAENVAHALLALMAVTGEACSVARPGVRSSLMMRQVSSSPVPVENWSFREDEMGNRCNIHLEEQSERSSICCSLERLITALSRKWDCIVQENAMRTSLIESCDEMFGMLSMLEMVESERIGLIVDYPHSSRGKRFHYITTDVADELDGGRGRSLRGSSLLSSARHSSAAVDLSSSFAALVDDKSFPAKSAVEHVERLVSTPPRERICVQTMQLTSPNQSDRQDDPRISISSISSSIRFQHSDRTCRALEKMCLELEVCERGRVEFEERKERRNHLLYAHRK